MKLTVMKVERVKEGENENSNPSKQSWVAQYTRKSQKISGKKLVRENANSTIDYDTSCDDVTDGSCRIGYQKWFVASGIVKSDVAAEKAFSGRHYNSGIRLLEESFDAIIQMRTEDLTTNYKDLDYHLKESLINVRKHPSEKNVNQVLNMPKFSHLMAQIVEVSDTQSQMKVTYLKDINIPLPLVFAARTSNFDLHLQSERQLLNLRLIVFITQDKILIVMFLFPSINVKTRKCIMIL